MIRSDDPVRSPAEGELRAAVFFDELHAALCMDKNLAAVDAMIEGLRRLREARGRLFCVGVGGGAANAAHAVCDFRKLCEIEAYAPSDGVAELTARINDEGWITALVGWLRVSRLSSADALMVFSVGGGARDVSSCIWLAVRYAHSLGARVFGVVGAPGGAVAEMASSTVVVRVDRRLLTPVTEAAQAAVLHALVSDPRLQVNRTKW